MPAYLRTVTFLQHLQAFFARTLCLSGPAPTLGMRLCRSTVRVNPTALHCGGAAWRCIDEGRVLGCRAPARRATPLLPEKGWPEARGVGSALHCGGAERIASRKS